MSKQIDFVIPITVDDDYDLHHLELKAINHTFKELYPNWDGTVYYNDEIKRHRYFISGYYKVRDHVGECWDTHHFSKIIELPTIFTMRIVEDLADISRYDVRHIECLSKL